MQICKKYKNDQREQPGRRTTMNYGEAIKNIRKSKGMTLKEACKETISLSQLSRFEKGKSSMRVDDFHQVLKHLNTTPAEFHFLQGDPEEKRWYELVVEIDRFTNSENMEQLQNIRHSLEKDASLYNWEYFLIIFIENMMALRKNESPKPDLVLNYLMQVEDWGEFELRVFIMFSFAFDVETTHYLMHTALKKSKTYLSLPQDMNLLSNLLNNTFSTFLYYDHLAYAEETLHLFENNYAETTTLIRPHLEWMFNKGLLAFKNGDNENGEKYCEQAIAMNKAFNQKENEALMRKRYTNWQKGIKNPTFRELTIFLDFFEQYKSE